MTARAAAAGVEPLPDALAESLARASAHPLDPDAARGVRWIQTHLSHVFLTRTRVYKLRKAVDLGFVRFARREERNADCLRELHLNRRLAPDVYLGVAPVERTATGWRVGTAAESLATGAGGSVPEHVVVMRRLAAGRDALSLLERRLLRPRHVEAVAETIARFHAAHRVDVSRVSAETWQARVTGPVLDNFRLLAEAPEAIVPRGLLRRAEGRARRFVAAHADRFEARRRAGRAVDGHGDLHLQHVFFEHDDAPPLLIDCLEFRDDLREIDAAAEVAFLAMDLAYRGRRGLAERFLRTYAAASDDFDLYRVLDFFVAYRAAVRAKVAAVAARDAAISPAQRAASRRSVARHLALSARAIADEAPRPGALVLTCGGVGSGKSSVAGALADALGGVVISSDRVRKRLAGMRETERPADAAAFYADARKEAVYTAMLERAEPVLASGRAAVLDATFDRAARRAAAGRLANACGAPAFLVEVRCAERVTRARLARREAAAADPSDAGAAVRRAVAAGFEPPREWPRARRFVVHTDAPWRANAREIARRVRAATAIQGGGDRRRGACR